MRERHPSGIAPRPHERITVGRNLESRGIAAYPVSPHHRFLGRLGVGRPYDRRYYHANKKALPVLDLAAGGNVR